MEQWKTFLERDTITRGYQAYQISSDGRVRNEVTGKIRKSFTDRKGYVSVTLFIEGKNKHLLVHRLVAENFIPNPEGKKEVDHINGDKTDNRVENLRWVTRKENVNNPITMENNIKAHNTPECRQKLRECRAKVPAGRFRGENNPNYKHGRYVRL